MPATKLVRDRIPEIIRADGREPKITSVQGVDLFHALIAKAHEEIDELSEATTPTDQIEELADALEVLQALAAHIEAAWSDVAAVAERKCRDRGGFEHGLVLHTD